MIRYFRDIRHARSSPWEGKEAIARSPRWLAGLFSLAILISSTASLLGQVAAKEPNRGGTVDLAAQDPQIAMERLTPAEGYAVNLFASEKQFPLGNPISFTFDGKGRLWVLTTPSYPQRLPDRMPDDKLIILEDTDGDGQADKHIVFADGLHVPTGFEIGDGGVYIAQQPNLIFVRDTDGDEVADTRQSILHGFGTEDSHHAISVFTWGPGGGLYFQEGTFHHSQVETPYGPVRVENAAVFRFEPRTYKFSAFVSYNYANPWGHVIDRFGQNFISDASNGNNHFGTAYSGHVNFPDKQAVIKNWTTTKVRPTSGIEFVRSRHFPDDAQGNFLINNVIGFHGIKQYQVREEGSGFVGEEIEPLLVSSDINFRPADLQFGPDGALYVCDWFNPLIGHMQYSVRDPHRDHSHGRIWRITHKDRPLLDPTDITTMSLLKQLDQLKVYEDRIRYRARRALREHPTAQVTTALEQWIAALDRSNTNHEHHLMEALWIYQQHDVAKTELLERLLRADEPRVRAAAVRVLQHWHHRIPNALSLLHQAVEDPFPRTRLEAVRALSFVPEAEAAEIALEAVNHEMDYYLDYTLKATLKTLAPHWKPALAAGKPFAIDNPAAFEVFLDHIDGDLLGKMKRSDAIYQALIRRPGVAARFRREAIDALARQNGLEPIQQLFDAMDQNPGASLRDLGELLADWDETDLNRHDDLLNRVAAKAQTQVVRSAAHAALIRINRSPDESYALASRSYHGLIDHLGALDFINDDALAAKMYETVRKLMFSLPEHQSNINQSDTGVLGRYVRIELPRKGSLSLAEVWVINAQNAHLATNGAARQSSTDPGNPAKRAIDGNRGGSGRAGFSRTRGGTHPWWELDLGIQVPIEKIVVWNHEQTGHEQLEGFVLTVLDEQRRPVFRQAHNPPDRQNVFEPESDPPALVHQLAMDAVVKISGHEAETFADLSGFVADQRYRDTAIAALLKLDQRSWPSFAAKALGGDMLSIVAATPLHQRQSQRYRNMIELGEKLAQAMPTAEAEPFRRTLAEIGSSEQLDSGKLVYMKTCVNCHQPGGGGLPGAFPSLINSPWLQNGEHATRIVLGGMMGPLEVDGKKFNSLMEPLGGALNDQEIAAVLTYVRNNWGNRGEAIGEDQVAALRRKNENRRAPWTVAELLGQEPGETHFVRNWSIDDLRADLARPLSGRSFINAKATFISATCTSCHRMKGEGTELGPDLTEVDKKYKGAALLREILEPSKLIEQKYRSYLIETEDDLLVGLILSEDDQAVRVATNPLQPDEVIEIPVDEIESKQPTTLSIMPAGLLDMLEKQQILDLLAYLESGGDPDHPVFKPSN